MQNEAASPSPATWRLELPRWLATLNPGRTVHEYEKAVRYFFDTPGVPEELSSLSFDLLLAYRGALALRAAPRSRGAAYMSRSRSPRPPFSVEAIDNSEGGPSLLAGDSRPEDGKDREHSTSEPRPLAPATVNLRLTALRQFLVHCTVLGQLPQLSADRVRAALRRLPIEHRRPYQILDESEWEEFLRAALLPARSTTTRPPQQATPASEAEPPHEPWGVPRAVRRAAVTALQTEAENGESNKQPGTSDTGPGRTAPVVRSRFGLTGVRTAQRDHALVSLALATGLRAIEIAQLDVRDLHREWDNGHEVWWLVLPDAKTKGQKGGRVLPLAPAIVETLVSYIRSTGRAWENPADLATPLFMSAYVQGRRSHPVPDKERAQERSRSAGRLLAGQIARVVDRVEAQWLALRAEEAARGETMQAGETRSISTHALRHSTAVALLAGNPAVGRPPASVEHVRGWLGHFDIRTTQGYLAHLDARRHRRPFALSPGSGAAQAPAGSEPVVAQDMTERDKSHTADDI